MANSARGGYWRCCLACTVLALLTLGQLVAVHVAVLTGLEYVAVIVFMVMGVGLIMARVDKLQAPDQLTRAGFLS